MSAPSGSLPILTTSWCWSLPPTPRLPAILPKTTVLITPARPPGPTRCPATLSLFLVSLTDGFTHTIGQRQARSVVHCFPLLGSILSTSTRVNGHPGQRHTQSSSSRSDWCGAHFCGRLFYLAKIVYFRKIAILLSSNQKFDKHENKTPHSAHPEASPSSSIPHLGCCRADNERSGMRFPVKPVMT